MTPTPDQERRLAALQTEWAQIDDRWRYAAAACAEICRRHASDDPDARAALGEWEAVLDHMRLSQHATDELAAEMREQGMILPDP